MNSCCWYKKLSAGAPRETNVNDDNEGEFLIITSVGRQLQSLTFSAAMKFTDL